MVHHAVIRWGVAMGVERGGGPWLAALPVVAETWDGTLNDIRGQHVTEADALAAMEAARVGPVTEGNVGGGTGMICHRFKGGIGTSSRIVDVAGEQYTVGVLVQCNYGSREPFRVAGCRWGGRSRTSCRCGRAEGRSRRVRRSTRSTGLTARARSSSWTETDAPVLAHQLERMARRVSLGIARNGSISSNGSGDIFVAFSTANKERRQSNPPLQMPVCSPTGGSVRSSLPRSRRRKRRSSTRWWRRNDDGRERRDGVRAAARQAAGGAAEVQPVGGLTPRHLRSQ